MGNPSFGVAIDAFFKDLGAKKGLEGLTGATMGLTDATAALRDKTWAATGSVRGFTDAGKEGFLDMSANLSRTAVLQGEVYSQTGDILSAQLKASVEAAESVGTVQELQKEFEAVGKAAVQDIGAFAKLQKVLQVSPSVLASWDKTLEAQGFTEKGVVSLTKEIGGLSTAMGVDPGPLLSQMPELTNLVRDRAAALGKEGPAFIQKYLKENVGLSAALTSQGLSADAAASAVVSLSRTTFDSAKQMKAALAGVGEGSIPELLRMTTISLGDFGTAFDLASKEGPLALVQAFQKKTEEIRKNTGNDKRAMDAWRQIMDKTVGDPALVALIVDGQKHIGKATAASQIPLEENLKAYGNLEDAMLKNARALRDRRDAAWAALKVDSAEKLVVPTMTHLWESQTIVLDKARGKLDEWVKSGNTAKATMAGIAGVTVLHGGDILDWATKAGGAIKNIKELGTAAGEFGGVVKGTMPAMGQFIGFMRTTNIVAEVGATKALAGLIPSIRNTGQAMSTAAAMGGPLLKLLGSAGLVAAAGALGFAIGNQVAKWAEQYTWLDKTLNILMPLRGAFVLLGKWFDRGGKKFDNYAAQLQVVRVGLEGNTVVAKEFADAMRNATTQEKKSAVVSEFFSRVGGNAGGEQKLPPRGPTPALPLSALPGGGPETRLAIQVLEESRAQTGILEQIAAALGAIPGMGAPSPAAPSSMRIDMHPDSGGLRLDRLLEVRARNVLGRSGYSQFGKTAFAN